MTVRQRRLGRITPTIDKLRARYVVDPATGCWVWLDSIGKRHTGYGYVWMEETMRKVSAHRASFMVHCRPLQPGELASS